MSTFTASEIPSASALGRRAIYGLWLLTTFFTCGCGTTRWTDTKRTATEQLLISDAIDNSVQAIDFKVVAGEKVFFDESRLGAVEDKAYLVSSIRQHLLATGCALADKKEDAEIIIEARAGAIGTDRHDLLYGIPATNVTSVVNIPGVPSSIPEIPFAKRTDQSAIAKIALFAYHRETGRAIWQSGLSKEKSRAKDYWVLGAGPIQHGAIHDGTAFAGQKINNPFRRRSSNSEAVGTSVDLTAEVVFPSPRVEVATLPTEKQAVTAPPIAAVVTKSMHEEPIAPPAAQPPSTPSVLPVPPLVVLPQPPSQPSVYQSAVPFEPPPLPER
jgi:hypothetical protein